jgi:hypothetical protein
MGRDVDNALAVSGRHFHESSKDKNRRGKSARHMWQLWQDNHFVDAFIAEGLGR